MAEKNKKVISFKEWDKAVEEIYKNESALSKKREERISSNLLKRIKSKADLVKYLDISLDDPSDIIKGSKMLHALDSNYARIISYFADMFFTRYTVVPEIFDEKIEGESFLELYKEMVEIVDGLNLETVLPQVIREVFISGSAYLYATESKQSKITVIRFLPAESCRTIYTTNYGTNVIEFNFDYFKDLSDEELIAETLALYPSEFTTLYNQAVSEDVSWLQLDPSRTTSILANEYAIPPLINSLTGILEYEDTREIEIKKGNRELQKILIHRIPVENGLPIFDVDEVKSIQKAMAVITRNHEGLETITAFGETKLHNLQEEGNIENKRVAQAYKSIFNSAGLNASPFTDKGSDSLDMMFSIDKAFVWNFITQFNVYINLIVNQLYSFKNSQAIIKFLPITVHKEKETVAAFRENASFGIGKLDALMAAGIKQKDLINEIKLEKELNLDILLTPLQSSHTQSGADEKGEKETVKEQEIKTQEVDEDEE